MTNSEIVQASNDAFFSGNEGAFVNSLAENFTFSGPVPEPMNKMAFAGMMSTMKKAFPDLSNNMEILREDGNNVVTLLQMAGTHTANFDLSAMHMPVFPATNKSFQLPRERCTYTVQNGKITAMKVDPTEGGGLIGIFAQLGIEMPS